MEMTHELTELWVVLSDTGRDALGLVSRCAELAEARSLRCRVWYLAPGMDTNDPVRLTEAGAGAITHLEVDTGACGAEQAVRKRLAGACRAANPAAVIFLSSIFSGAVAPALAGALGVGITADCTGLAWDESGFLLQNRPTFGGRRLATILTRSVPAIATVRRGVFPPRENAGGGPVSVEREELELTPLCRMLGSAGLSASPLDLRRAEIVVAGGAGLGSRENFERLTRLAALLGGEAAASRGAVAAGYARYDRQVGQTGITIRPRLYIAVGISGAVQHLSGMIDSGTIVAVNPDRSAPIHQVSNYSVYADGNAVVAALLAALGKKRDDNKEG